MKIIQFFDDATNGRLKPWQVVVFCYLPLLIPLTIAAQIGKELMAENEKSNTAFLLFAIIVLYQIWIGCAIWRCSKNSSQPIYKFISRFFSILFLYGAGQLLRSITA